MKINLELSTRQAMEVLAQLKAEGLEDHYQEWLARQAFPDNIVQLDQGAEIIPFHTEDDDYA